MKLGKVLLVALILICFIAVFSYFSFHNFNIQEVRDNLKSFGSFVPLVIFIMIIITSSLGFIFLIPVAVAALVLDIYSAFFISILGLTIGAMISFTIARYLGKDYVEKHLINRVKRLKHYDNSLRKNGFVTIFFLRLATLVPYELINIFAGFSEMDSASFFFGTLLGIIPGTLLTIYLIKSTNYTDPADLLTSAVIMTVFSLLPLLSKNIKKILFDSR